MNNRIVSLISTQISDIFDIGLVNACRLFGAKLLPQTTAGYHYDPFGQTSAKFESNTFVFFKQNAFKNIVCKMSSTLS